jgi:non-specific serine/threonine protein kinase
VSQQGFTTVPALRILATSREALGILGEQSYRVPSLSLPEEHGVRVFRYSGVQGATDDRPSTIDNRPPAGTPDRLMEYEAVRLFVDRARLRRATFTLTNGNAAAVAQICQRLDGIPLAIELAAVPISTLSVEQIARRLDDRFALLTGGNRGALPRQQTLRATMDWSYALLAEAERTLLGRLSVFAGGWTLDAAKAVCADPVVSCQLPVVSKKDCCPSLATDNWQLATAEVLDLLSHLVEQSLVMASEGGGPATRYRLLETVRQYARERLWETTSGDEVQRRHCDYFLRLAEEAAPKIHGPDQVEWLDRLEGEHANLRAAMDAAIERGETDAALRLGGALGEYWEARGYWSEGWERLTRLLALTDTITRTAARGKALYGAGMLAHRQGDNGAAQALFEESLAVFRELGCKSDIPWSLYRLGWAVRDQGEYECGRALFVESLALFRELDDREGLAWSLGLLGQAAHDQGDYGTARTLFEQSLAIYRELDYPLGVPWSLDLLGQAARDQGDYETAWARFEETLAIYRKLGNRPRTASALCELGLTARDQGEYTVAQAHFEASLAIYLELRNKGKTVRALKGLAAVAVAQAQSERAARLFGAAEALREEIRARLPLADRAEQERSVVALRTALGEEGFAVAWAEGRALSLEAAVAYALEGREKG